MIQLRRIRTYFPGGKPKDFDASMVEEGGNVTVESHQRLFEVYEEIVATIPKESRWNLHYLLGYGDGGKERSWQWQDVIPFDVDYAFDDGGEERIEEYLALIFPILRVERDKCAIVLSGHGLHVIVQVEQKIESIGYFEKHKGAYARICEQLDQALEKAGLPGKMDCQVFAPNRSMRMPGTENRKDDRPTTLCRLYQGGLKPQAFLLTPTAEDAPAAKRDKHALTKRQLNYFKVDTPAVEAEDGCQFLRWARTDQANVREPPWYAMLGVVGRLTDGQEKAHAYSREYPRYTETETEQKLAHALDKGPRTCEGIDTLWDGCKSCPHWTKVVSPLHIKSPSFIATVDSGFHLLSRQGKLEPQHEDLRLFFEQEHPYRTHEESAIPFVFNGKKYKTWNDTRLRNYADQKFLPKPMDRDAREFARRVDRTNLVEPEWFVDSIRGAINFNNGVYDIKTRQLSEHTADRAFLYVLPYGFDPDATCPVFDQFMKDVTLKDDALERMLLEFVGYAICDRSYWLQMSLYLIGEGSNGKTTFINVVKALVGTENVSSLSMAELGDANMRRMLEGKLVNLCDELPQFSHKHDELLKKLTSGGAMSTKTLYKDVASVVNTAKFIKVGNVMPPTTDLSPGFMRRIGIAPFEACFALEPAPDGRAKPADTLLEEKMLQELPGILNRVLHHYQEMLARRSWTSPDRSKKELQRYKDDVDRVGVWVRETLDIAPTWEKTRGFSAIATLFEKYVSDAKRDEEKPMTKTQFMRHLRRIIKNWDERHDRQRIPGDKNETTRPWVLYGVTFQSDAKSNF